MRVSEKESVCLLLSSPGFRGQKEDRAQEVPARFQLEVHYDWFHTVKQIAAEPNPLPFGGLVD